MELQRYQWVGLLAGVPLFSGAWLSAYYNTPWWGVLGLLITAAGIFISNLVERKAELNTHVMRGLIAGLLAMLVARALGYVAMMLSGAEGFVKFASLGDMFRAVLAGDWLATFWLLLLGALLGAALVTLEPTAKTRKETR